MQELFFLLLQLGLDTKKEHSLNAELSAKNWDDLFSLGIQQGVAAIQFDGLQKLMEKGTLLSNTEIPKDIKLKWFAHTMQVEKRCLSQKKLAEELAEAFATHGIRTTVLKGIAIGSYYPQPLHRPCGDLDCYLNGEYEKGNNIAETLGANVDRGFYKDSTINYKGLTVENHRYFTPIRASKRTKDFEKLLLAIHAEEISTKIGNSHLECPSPLFNALFLTHHSLRHFLTEGIALRHLCDWAMLIKQQGKDIDWNKFNDYCSSFGLKHFADSMTRLSRDLLGIPIPDNCQIGEDKERDTYLLNEILYGQQHLYSTYTSTWKMRTQLIKNLSANQKRYRLFSDTSFFKESLRLVYGFLFDRHPH